MFLQRLEIQGFKSFANKTILSFTKPADGQGATAIVGPNGSGKSNIVDAIRWALGEQSLKVLRGKRASDVIFFGSKEKSSLSLAEVSLYLNNEQRTTDLDYDEIILTRRVFRGGEGEYLINKAKVRLQDVIMLLAKANFGQRTYGIIGQGMVDAFLNSPYSERQEFFSEAANIKQHQIKREQSLNKLEKTEENLSQVKLLLGEIEPRLRTLTRQVKRLEKREAIEEELKVLQADYYGSLWQNIKERLEKAEAEISSQKEKEARQEKALAEVKNKLESLRKRKGRGASFEELQRQLENLDEKRNLILGEKLAFQGDTPLKFDEQELAWQKKRLNSLAQGIAGLKKEKETLESRVKDHQNDYNRRQKLLTEFDKESQELNKRSADNLPIGEQDLMKILQNLKVRLKKLADFQKDLIEKLKGEEIFQKDDFLEKIGQIYEELIDLESELDKIKPAQSHDQEALRHQLSKVLEEKKVVLEQLMEARLGLEISEGKINFLAEKIKEAELENDILTTKINLAKQRTAQSQGLEKNDKRAELVRQLEEIENEISVSKEKISLFNQGEEKREDELFGLQRRFQEEQTLLDKIRSQLSEFKINLAKTEAHREDLEKEIAEELTGWKEIITNNPAGNPVDLEKLKTNIQRLKNNLETIGGIDQETVQEYQQTKERFDFLSSQSIDLREALGSLEKVIEELDQLIKKQFEEAFAKINLQFDKYFKILFNGGRAQLTKKTAIQVAKEEATNGEDIPEETKSIAKKFNRAREMIIEIEASPPGKKIKNISTLSGGERALTALALICAIIANNPSPFIVIDEVDATLDEANSRRFAKILDDLSAQTQIIAITHNRNTMEIAQQLYGVTMGKDSISKLVSIKLEEAANDFKP